MCQSMPEASGRGHRPRPRPAPISLSQPWPDTQVLGGHLSGAPVSPNPIETSHLRRGRCAPAGVPLLTATPPPAAGGLPPKCRATPPAPSLGAAKQGVSVVGSTGLPPLSPPSPSPQPSPRWVFPSRGGRREASRGRGRFRKGHPLAFRLPSSRGAPPAPRLGGGGRTPGGGQLRGSASACTGQGWCGGRMRDPLQEDIIPSPPKTCLRAPPKAAEGGVFPYLSAGSGDGDGGC